MMKNTPISSERLLLRPFSVKDGEGLFGILSDPETVRYEPYRAYTRKESYAEAERRETDPDYTAVLLPDGTLIGTVYLKESGAGSAELGYIFNRRCWGQGYASEAVRAKLRDVFAQTHIRRVTARCNPENVRSWRLLERIGMRREGHLVKNIAFSCSEDGQPIWQDTYLYAILREEFPEKDVLSPDGQ